jgi:hypothetical protein
MLKGRDDFAPRRPSCASSPESLPSLEERLTKGCLSLFLVKWVSMLKGRDDFAPRRSSCPSSPESLPLGSQAD